MSILIAHGGQSKAMAQGAGPVRADQGLHASPSASLRPWS